MGIDVVKFHSSVNPRALNHYVIVGPLGKGGMGEVFVAEDTRLHRKVALKLLSELTAADSERRQRFEREAQAVAAINHPNIVTIHSVEEDRGIPFLTMELDHGSQSRSPPGLARVIRRSLAKDPSRRYQTATDLRSDLEELKQEIDSGVTMSMHSVRIPGRNRNGRSASRWSASRQLRFWPPLRSGCRNGREARAPPTLRYSRRIASRGSPTPATHSRGHLTRRTVRCAREEHGDRAGAVGSPDHNDERCGDRPASAGALRRRSVFTRRRSRLLQRLFADRRRRDALPDPNPRRHARVHPGAGLRYGMDA